MNPRSLRSLLPAAFVTACVLPVLLAGPGATAATAPTPSASPAPLTGAAPAPAAGWYLATVDHGQKAEYGGIDADTQRLELVSPTGQTATVYERPVSRKYGGMLLLDWSADGRTALLTATEQDGARAIRVDVTTGAVQEVRVPLLQTAVLDPAGTGILATRWKTRRSNTQVLDRIDWTGARTRLREGVGGSLTVGRNGTVITAGDRGPKQFVLSTTDGTVVSTFRGRGYCTPVRWWDATSLLEWCGGHADLFLVDPATGTSRRLTSQHGRGDYAHLDARRAGDRLYVQVGGACGYSYVGRQTDSGAVKHLRVPGAVGSVLLVDAVGDDLVLQHAASCDGDQPRSVLSRFDPVHHEEAPLVELGRREAFGRILVFGEVRASAY